MIQPRFAIVNTCDAPERRHVAEWVDGVGYCYMARNEEPHLKDFDGMRPVRPTSMEDFGFDADIDDRAVTFTRVRETRATYEDGELRPWQDRRNDSEFTLPRVSGVRPRRASKRKQ